MTFYVKRRSTASFRFHLIWFQQISKGSTQTALDTEGLCIPTIQNIYKKIFLKYVQPQ